MGMWLDKIIAKCKYFLVDNCRSQKTNPHQQLPTEHHLIKKIPPPSNFYKEEEQKSIN
jgi:hypothetical protein